MKRIILAVALIAAACTQNPGKTEGQMKARVIQPLFAMDEAGLDASYEWTLQELRGCDPSLDIVVLPEFSEVPGKTSSEGFLETVHKYGPKLLKTCEETRTLLLTQFPARQNVQQCPDIRETIDQYNNYVDSIASMTCKVRPAEASPVWDDGKGLDTKMVYSQARQLDRAVARWLVSKDELERQDLVTECLDIIQDMSAMIQRHKSLTPAEQKAVKVYREAEQYFRRTCRQ